MPIGIVLAQGDQADKPSESRNRGHGEISLTERFTAADTDKSGYISLEEMTAVGRTRAEEEAMRPRQRR